MLVFNQAILFNHLTATLVSPMQLQHVGIHVNDKPKFLALNPTDDHNSIVVPSDDGGITLQIPLCIQGVTTYFDSRN